MMIVTVYTTATCPYCKMAKDYLDAHDIKYKEIDVKEHPEKGEAIVKKSGEIGVPQIEIKENKDDPGIIIVGFDKEELQKKLKIHG